MLTLLLIDGLISLFFGILFLVAPESFWKRIGDRFNRSLFVMDGKLRVHNMLVGVISLSMGAWFIFFALAYSYTVYHLLGVILIAVGLIYVTKPDFLLRVSKIFSRQVVAFDNLLITSRTGIGILLIIISVYIFLMLFMALAV